MPNVLPQRSKSVASPIGAPAHPKLPGRPSRPNNAKPADASSKEPSANLIGLSEEMVTVNPPVPKPRPRLAARSNVSSPENGSAEPTLPSPIKPTRRTIIKPKVIQTPSNDARVNGLKAAFEKRRSGMNHPAPAPRPKPKPSIAQKPSEPSNPVTSESKASQPNNNSGLSAEKRLMANLNGDLSGGDTRSSTTSPSRRKRPTIIRAGVVLQGKRDGSDTPEKVNEPVPGKGPHPAVKSPVGRPRCSPTPPRKQQVENNFQDDQKSSSLDGVQKSAPARPKPAARKVTPPGPPKSTSAHDLGSAQLSAPPQDSPRLSVTPPPRKRKTGPPSPAQHSSLSGSLSLTSLSTKTHSSPALRPNMDPSSDQKPSRPRRAPPSRPHVPPSKPPGPKVTPPRTDTTPSGSSRKVTIHEVYLQSKGGATRWYIM